MYNQTTCSCKVGECKLYVNLYIQTWSLFCKLFNVLANVYL